MGPVVIVGNRSPNYMVSGCCCVVAIFNHNFFRCYCKNYFSIKMKTLPVVVNVNSSSSSCCYPCYSPHPLHHPSLPQPQNHPTPHPPSYTPPQHPYHTMVSYIY